MGVKAKGIPRVCHHDSKTRPHPWNTHYQFAINTLLSKGGKKGKNGNTHETSLSIQAQALLDFIIITENMCAFLLYLEGKLCGSRIIQKKQWVRQMKESRKEFFAATSGLCDQWPLPLSTQQHRTPTFQPTTSTTSGWSFTHESNKRIIRTIRPKKARNGTKEGLLQTLSDWMSQPSARPYELCKNISRAGPSEMTLRSSYNCRTKHCQLTMMVRLKWKT